MCELASASTLFAANSGIVPIRSERFIRDYRLWCMTCGRSRTSYSAQGQDGAARWLYPDIEVACGGCQAENGKTAASGVTGSRGGDPTGDLPHTGARRATDAHLRYTGEAAAYFSFFSGFSYAAPAAAGAGTACRFASSFTSPSALR